MANKVISMSKIRQIVHNDDSPGTIKLATKSVNRARYVWQMCTDPNLESNWQTLSMITLAKYTAIGLKSGTKYYFRVSVVDRNGQGPWSNVLSVISLLYK